MNISAVRTPPTLPAHLELQVGVGDPSFGLAKRSVGVEVGAEPLDLPPALTINPIGAAYRPASRLTSLGISVLVWTLVGGGSVLLYRLQAKGPARRIATEAVSVLLNETDKLTLDGGGHQGGGQPPPQAAPPPEQAAPPPPAAR